MRISRVYCPDIDAKTTYLSLSKPLSHYLIHVLRHKKQSPVILFNNQDGYEYYGDITQTDAKEATVEVTDRKIKNNESNIAINIFQALSKGDKLANIVQKTTELGVASITPVITEYTQYKLGQDKNERWQKIAISAAEQSGRVFFPIIRPVSSLNEILLTKASINLILSPRATITIKQHIITHPNARNFNILIGPEGGFSQDEMTMAIKAGYDNIALGPRILRTETTPIAICAILQALWGDF